MPCKHDRQKGKNQQPPISLHPLTPEDALSGLMQVKHPRKEPVKGEEESGESEPEPEEAS